MIKVQKMERAVPKIPQWMMSKRKSPAVQK